MKLFFCTIILGFAAIVLSAPLAAENLLDVVEKAQKTINQKYSVESSVARKIATEELEKIARSDKSEDEKIAAILAKFPDPVTEMMKAAEQGDAEAQFNLGRSYDKEKKYSEAVKWYRKSAEQGYASAQYHLGICYYNGNGISKDLTEAVKWLRKAAEQGNEDAKKQLAAPDLEEEQRKREEAKKIDDVLNGLRNRPRGDLKVPENNVQQSKEQAPKTDKNPSRFGEQKVYINR